MICDKCETDTHHLINGKCEDCQPKQENRSFLFIPGKGCAKHGYRRREQGKVCKMIIDRGKDIIAKGG